MMPIITTAIQGYPHTLSGWMKEYSGSVEHSAALQKAILSGPESLAHSKQDVVWISDHIDFGLKHAGQTLFSYADHVYLNVHAYCDEVDGSCCMYRRYTTH